MSLDVCAVVLAAGEGRRLRPLTEVRPKALCPVGNVPLLDRVLSLVDAAGFAGPDSVAVNASWLAGQVMTHVGGRAHVSVEPGGPLGTGGGLGQLRDWIDGRAVLVGNADAYLGAASGRSGADPSAHSGSAASHASRPGTGAVKRPQSEGDVTGPDISALLDGWDHATVRLLGVPTTPDDPYRFGVHKFAGFSLLPWSWVARLRPEPSDLAQLVWRAAERAGQLQVVPYPGVYLDTGTPARYMAANLHATGGGNLVAAGAEVTGRLEKAIVGPDAVVHGTLRRSVVWPGGYVGPDEHLVGAVRVGTDLTMWAG